jgi:hypothetical protein
MSDQLPTLAGMREGFQNGDVTILCESRGQPSRDGLCSGAAPRYIFLDGPGGFWRRLPSRLSRVIVRCIVTTCRCARTFRVKVCWINVSRYAFRSPRTKMLVLRHDRRRIEMIEELLRKKRRREAQKAIRRSTQIRHVRLGRADVENINAHTVAMAARYVFYSKEVPDIPQLLQGECMNMRQVLTDYPDGIFEFKAHYPQHPAPS